MNQIIAHYEIEIGKNNETGWKITEKDIDENLIEPVVDPDPFLQRYLVENTKFKGLKNLGHSLGFHSLYNFF